jgi:HEAT repeat protein
MRAHILLATILGLGLVLVSAKPADAKKQTITELVEVIDGPKRKYDFVDKYDAVRELGALNSAAAAQELASRLNGPFGHAAAAGLASMDNVAALPIIIAALPSADDWNRSVLCVALANIGGSKATTALVDLMDNDSHKWVRRQAVYALGTEARRNPSGPAVQALVKSLDTRELEAIIRRVLWRVHSVKAAPTIRKLLQSPSSKDRGFACDWLRSRRDSASTTALFALLKVEQDKEVIAKATVALSVVHSANRADDVARLLTSGLQGADPKPALKSLSRTLKHRTGPLAPKLAKPLVQSLHRLFAHSDRGVARTAVIVAGSLGHPSTAAHVIPLLKDDDSYMRGNAFDALAATMTTRGEAKVLFAAMAEKRGLSNSLRTTDKRKGLAKLVLPGLKAKSKHDRIATAGLLQRLADPVAGPALVKALAKETDRRAAGAFADALRTCRNLSVLPAMVPLLYKRTAQTDVWETFISLDRQQSFKASRSVIAKGGVVAQNMVARVSGYAGDEILFQWAAGHKEANIRRAAASQLSNVRTLGSVGLLCKLLLDSDQSTQRSAAKSLGEIPFSGSARCLVGAIPRAAKTVLFKEAIYQSLRELSGEKFPNTAKPWKGWLKDKMGLGKGVPGLAVALQSDSSERISMAANAAQRLSKKDVRRLLPALLGALDKTHNTRIRVALIGAIASAGAASSRALLRKDLDRLNNVDELSARAQALYASKDNTGLVLLVDKLEKVRYQSDTEKVAAALAAITGQGYSTDFAVWKSRLAGK